MPLMMHFVSFAYSYTALSNQTSQSRCYHLQGQTAHTNNSGPDDRTDFHLNSGPFAVQALLVTQQSPGYLQTCSQFTQYLPNHPTPLPHVVLCYFYHENPYFMKNPTFIHIVWLQTQSLHYYIAYKSHNTAKIASTSHKPLLHSMCGNRYHQSMQHHPLTSSHER